MLTLAAVDKCGGVWVGGWNVRVCVYVCMSWCEDEFLLRLCKEAEHCGRHANAHTHTHTHTHTSTLHACGEVARAFSYSPRFGTEGLRKGRVCLCLAAALHFFSESGLCVVCCVVYLMCQYLRSEGKYREISHLRLAVGALFRQSIKSDGQEKRRRTT